MADTTVAYLRSPGAIRERCGQLMALCEAGRLTHFAYDPSRLDATADLVIAVTRESYPDLKVPVHSRWRHFDVGGVDRVFDMHSPKISADRWARDALDLVVTSVLLDAGAGDAWRYREVETGQTFSRSEGLAVASFRMFMAGAFSSDPRQPRRADAAGLLALDAGALRRGFQVTDTNPLVGVDGRLALLHGLGRALAARTDLFGSETPRFGALFDTVHARDGGNAVRAATLLGYVLDGLGSIWPGRVTVDGVNLGDVWPHAALGTGTDALVPFHKLSQWLTYSLFEVFESCGVTVTGGDELTGLPEYRNGGLMLDMGLLVPKHPDVLGRAHGPGDEVVVEWRALTVTLLDRVAARVRERLGVSEQALPLASVLQGGTWTAGRKLAAERRRGGGSPLTIVSDGTVF